MMIKDMEMSEDLTSAELSTMRGGSGIMALVGALQAKAQLADEEANDQKKVVNYEPSYPLSNMVTAKLRSIL